MLPVSAQLAPPLQHHSSSSIAPCKVQVAPASQNKVWPSHQLIQAGSRQDRLTNLMSINWPALLCQVAEKADRSILEHLQLICRSRTPASQVAAGRSSRTWLCWVLDDVRRAQSFD